MRPIDDPMFLSPDQRLHEVAGIMAAGVLRLHARDLQRHLAAHKLKTIAASDATDNVYMKSASLLCICDRQYEDYLPGTRIW